MPKKSLVIIENLKDKPFFVLPGESLTLRLCVDFSEEDKTSLNIDRLEIDLKVDFREPFSSDSIVVTSARANVEYAAIDGKKANV